MGVCVSLHRNVIGQNTSLHDATYRHISTVCPSFHLNFRFNLDVV